MASGEQQAGWYLLGSGYPPGALANPQALTEAMRAWGGALLRADDLGVLVIVPMVHDLTDSWAADELDVTAHDSLQADREFIAGLKGIEVNGQYYYRPGEVTHQAMLDDHTLRRLRDFLVVRANGSHVALRGYVIEWNLGVSVDQPYAGTVRIRGTATPMPSAEP